LILNNKIKWGVNSAFFMVWIKGFQADRIIPAKKVDVLYINNWLLEKIKRIKIKKKLYSLVGGFVLLHVVWLDAFIKR